MSFKNYFAGTIFVILLIWGPIDHSWPVSLLTSWLVLPLVVWLILSWVWNRWQPTEKLESTLNRVLSGVICLGLFTLAVFEATSTSHIGNTQTIRTRDGYEDVGDYIELSGPNYGNVFVIIIIAIFFLWFGVLKKGAKNSSL